MRQSQDLAWFWLAIIHHFLWWLLPEEVGLALMAISLVAGFITYLLLNVFAPQEPLLYVPKKRRKHVYCFTFPILRAMNLCATLEMTRISNMKACDTTEPWDSATPDITTGARKVNPYSTPP